MASSADLISATPPKSCALAVAMPLDRGTFVTDSYSGPAHDFVRGMLRGRTAEDAWEADGQPLADLCGALLSLADGLGVATAAAARLSDLAGLFSAREVVTIVAHWRGAAFVADDFSKDPDQLVEAIRHGADELCRDLAQRLPTDRIAALLVLPETLRRADMAELLNEVAVRSDRPLPDVAGGDTRIPVVIDELSLRSRQRARLDAAFPTFFRPGNRLELRDGMHAAAAVAGCVPEGWSGIVDFAVCRSAFLAHAVKHGRPERRVITNQHEVLPGVRLRIQQELYCRLQHGGNYASELMTLFVGLADLRRRTEPQGAWHRLRRMLHLRKPT